MEPLNSTKPDVPKWLILSGLVLLITGMLFGLVGSFQYIFPGLFKQYLSFEKIRPLHVSSVVFWILFAATGSVLAYLQEHTKRKLFAGKASSLQLKLFVLAVVLILSSYVLGKFGGREYWEFPPPLALILAAGWILFIIQVAGSVKTLKQQPVYIWMWLTGAFGFLFTFTESYLWVFSYFNKDIVRDMTVQWKSYGSIVGSWNMLVYGVGMFLMEKISQDKSYSRSSMAFALYFLGLFNLMFNWSHHIYTLPVNPAIRHVGYLVSMTELFILGRIIYKWKSSVTAAQKNIHNLSYRFLVIADVWIFINLFLAILISIPAINVYTHGTHITVAHVMGTTIGINTMLLLAVAIDLLSDTCRSLKPYYPQIIRASWLANISLFVFLASLFVAGVERSRWQMSAQAEPFSQMMKGLAPYFIVFAIAGLMLFVSFSFIVFPLLKNTLSCFIQPRQRSIVEFKTAFDRVK
ncbi:MAG TPA: cbb3-type cytochrome c oxidase subunit I [Cyclobacteriaceae bacterium]|jgi:nitric oxide reductase subunit B|nr:cbb3-type cytochrome c oxidase subunit I [Cyclobacteriaceae bacterium]